MNTIEAFNYTVKKAKELKDTGIKITLIHRYEAREKTSGSFSS